jgi:hypothetical protein
MMPAMNRRSLLQAVPIAFAAAGSLKANALGSPSEQADSKANRTYELRVYHPAEGKLPELLRRFRDHTMALFEKHGMRNVAYWTPTDAPQKGNQLVYMLEHPSREAADANWSAFRADPEWVAVKSQSEANGKLVEKIDSTYLSLTDFSPQLR